MDITELPDASPSVLDALSAATLMALQHSADAHMSAASKMQAILHDVLARRYARGINGFGTTHVTDGDIDIAVTIPKKVKWNADKLREIGLDLATAGEDVDDYIETTLSVQERKYTAWPASLAERFESARTLERGKPTFKLKMKEAA